MQHNNLEPAFSYMMQLIDKNKRLISPQEYEYCVDIIGRFWDWWHGKDSLSADDLYLLLCEESDLGAKCLYDFAAHCQADGNEALSNMWECIVAILMIMVRIAYQNEGAAYVPQDLENINAEKMATFLEQIKPTTTAKELLENQKGICY